MKSLIAFTTTRRDGNARRPAALRKMLVSHGVSPAIATSNQVHGTRIVTVPRLRKPRHYPGVDGFLTAEAEQPLGIFTADCVPIFLSVPSQGVVGLLHAGWRGVRGGILLKALRKLRQRWGIHPSSVRVWLGPSIGPCCFEVQWDVARFFPSSRRRRRERWVVDLEKEIRRQVRQAGAVFAGPEGAPCTMHQRTYHSFRRDQTDERQISVIMRKPR